MMGEVGGGGERKLKQNKRGEREKEAPAAKPLFFRKHRYWSELIICHSWT